jgi:DNA-binding winged helix-turn-helix (wHTH) protein
MATPCRRVLGVGCEAYEGMVKNPLRVHFGGFVLDADRRQLRSEAGPVHLTPKAYELLALLVEERPRAVSKEEIQDRLWPKTYVTESSLMSIVAEVRAAIGESGHAPRWVHNVRSYGYAFGDPDDVEADLVRAVPSPAVPDVVTPASPVTLTSWVDVHGERFALTEGDNSIGRDATAQVVVDHQSVSRHHATLTVKGGEAVLGDRGSKNGTFVNGRPVVEPVVLRDGQMFRVGTVTLVFRSLVHTGDTETVTE